MTRIAGFISFVIISTGWAFTQGPNRFSGEIVSIDLTGDIRDFFQAIAPVSGYQLDADPSIKRNVTVHVKDVPWNLALDTVLKTSGLSAEFDGTHLRIAAADPGLGQNHVLMGTMTIEGKITEFNLQNPRTIIQVRAPGPGGDMQPWRIEWESADDLISQMGIKPALHVGDQVMIAGNLIRSNTIRLITLCRLSDGFSWGGAGLSSSGPSDGVMFVSGLAR
jgi:hypothetical protein